MSLSTESLAKLPVAARHAILDARPRRCGSGHTSPVCSDRVGAASASKEFAAQRVGAEAQHAPALPTRFTRSFASGSTDKQFRGYSAALDLSGKEAGFALVDGKRQDVVIRAFLPVSGRGSPSLLSWLSELLDREGIELSSISRWSVGSGPGSFTGMRMAAALVAGLTYGKKAEARCVPTAIALAMAVKPGVSARVAAIFDGRNREVLVYGMECRAGVIIPAGCCKVLNSDGAGEYFASAEFDRCVAFAYDIPAIGRIVPASILSRIESFEHLAVENLIYHRRDDYDGDLTALEYIRPAVYPKLYSPDSVRNAP